MSKGKDSEGPLPAGSSKGKDEIPELIRLLAADRMSVSAGQVARAAGVTRQAAHFHLARMVRDGELERVGAGRGTRYLRRADLDLRFPIAGLEEHRVWAQVEDSVPEMARARENVRSILAYSFTEMLNNAIDHSGGDEARVIVSARPERFWFEVHDDGVGAFRHVRERLGLEDELEAIQQLSKGKETTAPERHSGEGIFFTSRAVDRFDLDANGLRWIVDTERGDQAVGDAPKHDGTRVRCEIDPITERTLEGIFARFVDEGSFEFSRTVVPLRLFQRGDRFVSRSEAKRLGVRLERFREATIDFEAVTEVGQGFVDELFRVWAADHPETQLTPINMSPVVERFVRRVVSAP
jgi:anti-sigma regulatory factor (Ser/Thr protein kinase)